MLPRFIDRALLREWTMQSLIVDQTHLALFCNKIVVQKSYHELKFETRTTPGMLKYCIYRYSETSRLGLSTINL